MKKALVGVSVPDLKLGMGVVADLFDKTRKPVPVRSRRGEVLALVVPEEQFENPGFVLEPVSGETFRRRRVTYLYGAFWGYAWLVEQRGGNFIVLPPEGRASIQHLRPSTQSAPASGQALGNTTPASGTDLVPLIVELSGKVGALEGRLAAIEARGRSRDKKAGATDSAPVPAPVLFHSTRLPK